MTPTEAVDLVTYVASACPSMRMEPGTPDAWYRLLCDLDAADCVAAVDALAKCQPYIAVSDIRAQVRSIREARLDRATHHLALTPPPADAKDYAGELRARITDLAGRRDLNRALLPPASRPAPDSVRDAAARARVDALAVRCSWCGADRGQPCTLPGTRHTLTRAGVHQARLDASNAQPDPSQATGP